jgi:hypothetical protein
MSHWQYRHVKHRDGTYGIHEVYLNDDNEIWAIAERPATGPWMSVDELITDIFLMIRAGARDMIDMETFEPGEAPFRIPEEDEDGDLELGDKKFSKILLDSDDGL